MKQIIEDKMENLSTVIPTQEILSSSPPIPKQKKKYNYTKKTGRPKSILTSCLPKDWQNKILKMCAKGYSAVEIRAALCWNGKKFNHRIWDELQKRDDEFNTIITKGSYLCEAWWTTQGRKALKASKWQAFTWFCNMKNRFGWRDRLDVDGSLNVNFTLKALIAEVHRATKENNSTVARISDN